METSTPRTQLSAQFALAAKSFSTPSCLAVAGPEPGPRAAVAAIAIVITFPCNLKETGTICFTVSQVEAA